MLVAALSACCLYVPAFTESPYIRLFSFIGYELVVGMWFTSFHSMRTLIVPSEGHATILSLYRLPLNCIVVLVILNIKNYSPELVFTGCFVMNLVAMLLQYRVHRITDKRSITGSKKTLKRGDSLTIDTPKDDETDVKLDKPPIRKSATSMAKSPVAGGVRVSPTSQGKKSTPKSASGLMKRAASPAVGVESKKKK